VQPHVTWCRMPDPNCWGRERPYASTKAGLFFVVTFQSMWTISVRPSLASGISLKAACRCELFARWGKLRRMVQRCRYADLHVGLLQRFPLLTRHTLSCYCCSSKSSPYTLVARPRLGIHPHTTQSKAWPPQFHKLVGPSLSTSLHQWQPPYPRP
jgi:hypothetical protein